MKRGGRRATPGSFAGVIAAYIGSDKFMRLAASTQGNYRRHLALAQSVLGGRDVEVMRPALVQAFLDGLSDRPATQKVAQTSLEGAGKVGHPARPTAAPDHARHRGRRIEGGHKPWTEAQIRTAIEHARPIYRASSWSHRTPASAAAILSGCDGRTLRHTRGGLA
jgi:hypothetical protein